MSVTTGPDNAPNWRRHLPLIAIVLVAVAGFVVLRDELDFEALREHRAMLLSYRDQAPVVMAAGFLGVYIAIVAFSLPGASITSVTGGFLFGLTLGMALNVMAATIGAALIFLAVRMGVGQLMNARLEAAEGRVGWLKQRLRENEISVLLLLRLVPAVPFFVANLLPAMVGVRFWNFLWTTAVGILPGALVFTWIGVGLGAVFERGETPDMSLLREPYVIGPLLGLCLLAALPILLRTYRKG